VTDNETTQPASRSLDNATKEKIKSWVLATRKTLEDDFVRGLKRLGVERTASTPLSKLDYLTEEERATRKHLDALLSRETKTEGARELAFDAIRREMAYTFLNRLVGLRCMEARGLLVVNEETTEVVTTRPEYGGLSRLLRDLRAAGGSKYKRGEDAEAELLRDGLTAAFAAVTADIRVLFDPDHEYSRLWPSFPTLKKVIRDINEGLAPEVFASPDFLGWVYQFFNVEEKKRIRDKTKGKPTTPYELAVINQFYTPDWIVKFLVDNTLGRVWREMHPDTRLLKKRPGNETRTVADYLVPRTGDDRRQPVRLARDLKLLDPACGTMHFGQYALGLLYEMYLEELERAGAEGWPPTASVSSPEEISAAILENNLYGIDIDARAIQIASLSLLLTAKETARTHGLPPTSVHVRKMNLIAADAVNLGEEELTKFLQRANGKVATPTLRRKLIEVLWENLQFVPQLGSLVKIGEDIDATARHYLEGGTLLREEDEARVTEAKDALIRSLHTYADKNRNDDSMQRLFAEDTARGFELYHLLALRYDAVVMNPPYGECIPAVKKFIEAAYPLTKNDLYATFVDRGTQLLLPTGYLGALVSSTFINLASFEKLRTHILLKRNPLVTMLDLGMGILDATVMTAALVCRGEPVA